MAPFFIRDSVDFGDGNDDCSCLLCVIVVIFTAIVIIGAVEAIVS